MIPVTDRTERTGLAFSKCVQHPIPLVETGVVMPLLKERDHSPVGRNRETREENGTPITTAPLNVSGGDLPLSL